jgi:uncharacterized lipoprotein YmbA
MRYSAVTVAVAVAAAVLLASCSSPEDEQQEYVKLFLNDPASAQFRGVQQSKRNPRAWCGEVNAKNRMGGMAGYTRYVLVMPDADLKVNVKSEVEEAKMLTDFYADGQEGFAGKWSVWCD